MNCEVQPSIASEINYHDDSRNQTKGCFNGREIVFIDSSYHQKKNFNAGAGVPDLSGLSTFIKTLACLFLTAIAALSVAIITRGSKSLTPLFVTLGVGLAFSVAIACSGD